MDPKNVLRQELQKVRQRIKEVTGEDPNICYVSRSFMYKLIAAFGGKPTTIDGIEICEVPNLAEPIVADYVNVDSNHTRLLEDLR